MRNVKSLGRSRTFTGAFPRSPATSIQSFLLALMIVLSPTFSVAQTTSGNSGLDTATSNDQYFSIKGVQVGDWTTSSLTITGQLVTTTTPSGTLGNITASTGNITATTGNISAPSGNVGANSVTLSGATNYGAGAVSAVSMYSSGYYHTSDARLKTDIHPISGALDKLLEIRGVEFNWKKDGHGDMGIVAQNVAQVFPNVVTKDGNGIMSVEYDSMVGPMIEAIRELKIENDGLKAKVAAIDDMKAQLKEISASLQALKKTDAQTHAIKFDNGAQEVRPSPSLAP